MTANAKFQVLVESPRPKREITLKPIWRKHPERFTVSLFAFCLRMENHSVLSRYLTINNSHWVHTNTAALTQMSNALDCFGSSHNLTTRSDVLSLSLNLSFFSFFPSQIHIYTFDRALILSRWPLSWWWWLCETASVLTIDYDILWSSNDIAGCPLRKTYYRQKHN